ncbi:hypothetical protein E4T56_gene16085 [Termitomyces sp. T112]|nr:hypothetical protein E4T56_gene16085 [Termitomyces sp. T112]KAH0591592.1 hypothetical protein H2248_001643 [Termitomyces sp. 'cryptogamus']
MSNQNLAAEQLLELLIQLKKTTPEAARSILNGQPQIAYALMTLMVKLNAVNFEVFQKTLAEFGTNSSSRQATNSIPAPTPKPSALPSLQPSVSSTPIPALPPHMQPQAQHYRTGTPPYPYSNGHTPPPQSHQQPPYSQPSYQQPPASTAYGYNQPQPMYAYPGYNAAAPAPQPAPTRLPDTLASIPEEQKALIMRVITMTPEQLNALPPQERQTYIQLRNTLGVPT